MKQQFGVSNLAEAKKLALYTAKTAASQKLNQLGEGLAKKALPKVSKSRLPPAVKDTINQLGTNPKAKRALTRKSKEILSNLLGAKPLTDNSELSCQTFLLARVLRGLEIFFLAIGIPWLQPPMLLRRTVKCLNHP